MDLLTDGGAMNELECSDACSSWLRNFHLLPSAIGSLLPLGLAGGVELRLLSG